MRVFLYARVSMEEKIGDKKQDPENQLSMLREECARKGWTILQEFVDEESGGSALREQFTDMISKLNKSQVDAVVIWKFDRLSRMRFVDSLILVDGFRKKGIQIYSIMEPYIDILKEEPTQDLTLAIIFWKAQQEKFDISNRTKLGVKKKIADGVYKGGRPKGAKDKEKRVRRWEKRPNVKIYDLFEAQPPPSHDVKP